MRRWICRLWVFLWFVKGVNAQIPKIGSFDRLDAVTWNMEWFGNSSNGPTNDDLQLQYVTDMVETMQVDLFALQEISDIAYWNRLLFNCDDYAGVLSTWSQTQKTGLLYKKSDFEFLYQKHILANYDYDFGSGRLPLEVGLIPKHKDWPVGDTLRVWVLHMKANTGSSSSKVLAYNRRYNAGLALKMYIDKLGKSNKGLVMGDWNDDFDQSILSGYATPYLNWIKDTNYAVTTYPLSLSKQRSTVSYSDMIDHIVCTPGLKNNWIQDSSSVLYADKWISNYGNVVSDHFPVYSRFNWNERLANSSNVPALNSGWTIRCECNIVYFEHSALTFMQPTVLGIYDFNGQFIKKMHGNAFPMPEKNKWYLYEIKDHCGEVSKRGCFLISDEGHVFSR
jgi:endonuclease/exonuclease/phosphatase family metal-dependent hydrolase